MRRCIFCPNPAGNAEHVVAEWLTKSMGRNAQPVIAVAHHEGQIIDQRPPVLFKGFRTKVVCATCNNGWMSDLENKFKGIVEELVQPRSFDEVETVETLLKANSDTIIRWMVKSAIIAEQASPRSKDSKPIVDERFYNIETMDLAGEGFYLAAAELAEEGFCAKLEKGVPAFNGGKYHAKLLHKFSLNFSVQLNRLALGVVCAPDSKFMGYSSHYRLGDGRVCIPMIPGSRVESKSFEMAHIFSSLHEFTSTFEVYVTEPPVSWEGR